MQHPLRQEGNKCHEQTPQTLSVSASAQKVLMFG